VDRPAAGLHALAILFRLVARLARDTDEASGVEMALAEVAPHFRPGVIGLGDQPAIAGRGSVSAADDAVMVAGRGERIGDGRALLQERHGMPCLDQRPGSRQAGDACANDNDVHAVYSKFPMEMTPKATGFNMD